jgi:hypothetical protein
MMIVHQSILLFGNINIGYIATTFSPNLVAFAALHASGQITVQPMQSDPSSPVLAAVIAQKFATALKKSGITDDILLVAEQYLSDGTVAQGPKLICRIGYENHANGHSIQRIPVRDIEGFTP